MDVGERLVSLMVGAGIKTGFGCTGGQTAPCYHGMAVNTDEATHVLMRDEQSASFAACDATVGLGAAR
ncbi:thiamine pyrophosphate-binding protein [Cryobacterium sp. Y11]|uniref:thiamine pyrophosphate-binding protein n=1 Tax=Cryobacterium sp. Y11 TaxID=2045016 RepID=UPI000CE54843